MPETRGVQATPEVKAEWERAYALYRSAPGAPHDPKQDRTERINYVAKELRLTHKRPAPCEELGRGSANSRKASQA